MASEEEIENNVAICNVDLPNSDGMVPEDDTDTAEETGHEVLVEEEEDKSSVAVPNECLSLKECETKMLERLTKNPLVVAKSQQRGEPDLSDDEKLAALRNLYCSFPVQFLIKYGQYIKPEDSPCFDKMRTIGNYQVDFHIKEIEASWIKGSQEKRLKNRRYEALKKLVETTDYFSEEEMQRRNPILYEQLIGKYHTEDERAAFLHQSWKSTSGSGTTSMPLTDMFLAHLERTSDGISCRRMAQESQQEEEDAADAEYDSDDEDMDIDLAETSKTKERKKPTVNDDEPREEIEDDEKELLREEFFTTMYRNFLNGKDEDFDYATVDDNPDYDCGENLDNDEEEKYFDDEEPCEVSEPNSDQDDLFRPPVRSSEIESKIEQLNVNSEQHTSTNETSAIKILSGQNTPSGSEDEDELDKYMREIEKQLGK